MRYGWSRWAGVALVAALVTGGCTGGGSDESTGAEAQRDKAAKGARGGSGGGAGGGAPADGREGADAADRFAPSASPGGPSGPSDYRSTFALDVDTASYGYARRTLRAGRLPAPATVRTEEFVNSFRQGYRRPSGSGFSVSADGARTGAEGWSLLRVGLATKPEGPAADRPPATLTFVLDVSGSMGEPGRLDLAKQALTMAADRLRAEDSVALVTFSGEARTVLPPTRMGSGKGKDGGRARLRAAVRELKPRDSTNLDAGLARGYEEAAEGKRKGSTNRVVLLSDALANTGSTDAGSMLKRVASYREDHGIALFGVGVGSSFGDALMERLTNEGDGHTAYISDRDEARKVFVTRLPRNIELTAREAKAQVTFDPDTVRDFRLLGYENRAVADEDFRDDRVDGGEVGPGHTVTALYAVRLKEGAEGHAATARVRWLGPGDREPHERSRRVSARELTARALWGEEARDTSPRLRVAAVAAYFAEALRSRGPGTYDGGAGERAALPGGRPLGALRAEARGLAERTEDGEVTELARAIERARKVE
ncbi:vWA domain-containing protein [Streptomyces boncukensis]|uniref:DUF3520 domain-containing protein n=1 Tax=Streptomyces boncukensis TaxID=2711219 RepID=A0A6G4WWE4_9ACTN|nr:von Willebrand factor type A domain-containing protein [Streptomyces boncukensis]NGO68854.1 DUF3520 domain-containing protein [Streptomyces boncukensis]